MTQRVDSGFSTCCLPLFNTMKSYFKYELARAVGVSMRTFSRWLSQNTLLLAGLGVMPHAKLIPARAAHWICGQYGIDEGEL